MSYYEFPHTRNYEQDLSFFIWIANHLKRRVEKLEERCTALETRMTTAENNIVDLQGRMTKAEEDIIELKKRISDAEQLIKDLTKLLNDTITELNELSETYNQFVKDFNAWKTEIEGDITNITNEITDINADISKIEVDITTINSTLTTINNTISEIKEKNTEIETRLTKLEHDIFHFADKKSTGLIYYINAETGNDDNSGLTADDPMKTLDSAIEKALINDFKVTFVLQSGSSTRIEYVTSYRNFANVTITFRGDDQSRVMLIFGNSITDVNRVNYYNCVAQFYNLEIYFNNAHHNNCSVIYADCELHGTNESRLDNNFLIESSQMYFKHTTGTKNTGVTFIGTNRFAVLNSNLVIENFTDNRVDVAGVDAHGFNQGGIFRFENSTVIFKKGVLNFEESTTISEWEDYIESFWSNINIYAKQGSDLQLNNISGDKIKYFIRGERNILTVGSTYKETITDFATNLIGNNTDEMPGEVVTVTYE